MSMYSRPFEGDDDALLLVEVAAAAVAVDPRCGYWHVGDVWWGLYQNTVFEPRDNVRLWLDRGTDATARAGGAGDATRVAGSGDAPVGFAWFYPHGGVSTLVRPGRSDEDALHTEMLGWAEGRRRALPPGDDGARTLTATAFAHDARRIALLERRGYARDDAAAPIRHFHRPLAESVPAATLSEVTLRHVGGAEEWPARVALHRDVWHPSRVTLDAYRRLRAAPGYTPELDIVAVAPGGDLASYCIRWLDPANRTGEFEPVGTHPAYHRRGLGAAVIAEGLRRLAARDATDAIVYTPASNGPAVALYTAAGFRVAGDEYDHVKRL